MAGSQLDPFYDIWRRRTKPTSRDKTFQAADAVRKQLTPSLAESQYSTLKWAKSYIQLDAQHARVEIDRLEADSKFFRSLAVITVPIALHFLIVDDAAGLAVTFFVLCAAAFVRYCDQRWKLTELSYATAVILHAAQASRGGAGT